MKILSIGNSFSQDAQAYLYQLAAAGGVEARVVNLVIGGCSLALHWQNAKDDLPNYVYEENGNFDGRMVSIKEALLEEDWDIVTFQQASHDSGLIETYEPYLSSLSAYVKELAPNAKQMIHQTWAYEIDSQHGAYPIYQSDQTVMYRQLCDCYQKAAERIGVDMIPSGSVIQHLRGIAPFDYKNGGRSLCRDGFHMDIPYGRYALAAIWYETLMGGDVSKNPYLPPEADPALIAVIKEEIHRYLAADQR